LWSQDCIALQRFRRSRRTRTLRRHAGRDAFGRWWQGGYVLRNKVVHRGYRPTRAEAIAGLDDAMNLIAAIKSGLPADVATKPIDDRLQWGKIKRGGAVHPSVPPWDQGEPE
jgi:hypothetical protein